MTRNYRPIPRSFLVLVGLVAAGSAGAESAPYPPSAAIESITFAPAETIVRKATGSDNWPVSWGDDDNIYTAFGDGWGFKPKLSSKAALGTARVSGGPTDFSGENLATIDSINGSSHKATGILMVDGVLYLWTRRDDGRLWTSSDHGQSWQNTGVTMAPGGGSEGGPFGSLAFCQFRRNYQGARDGYVYVYARNQGQPADEVVMFRVPKDKVAHRASYEFYAGIDGAGDPVWTLDIDQRQPVFSDPGRITDLRIAYNPGIDRYLMTYWFGTGGGIGIFDAPEPWGPWTTVFYTSNWDQGFTFEYGFPTKWISADGLTMYMVFSGTGANDAFCVRKCTLRPKAPSDATPPSEPTGLNAAPATETRIDLSWTAATDAESGIGGYKIYRGLNSGGESFLVQVGNVTSYSDTGLAAKTTYYYRVSALNGAGLEGSLSNEASATTLEGPPLAPSGLSATAVSTSQIDLAWTDNSDSETGFRIERAEGASGALSVALKAYNGTNTPPTGEEAGTGKCFKVGSPQTNDRSDTWSSVPPSLDGATRLLCARDDKADAGYNSMYVVSLSAPAAVYAVVSPEYHPNPMPFMDATWADTGMTADATNKSGYHVWKKDAPAGDLSLGADDATNKQGACYVFTGGGSWTEIATAAANATTYQDKGLTAQTTCTYRVCATNASGDSGHSNEASATTGGGAQENQPPSVEAGSDQAITLPASATLDGTVSDPDRDALTTTWSKVSGPGEVTFGDPAALDTTASFSEAGSYVLRLTADDGELQASDEMAITVLPEPSDDTDGDGLPDGWEEEHFGSMDACDPDEDTDIDGLTNAQEFAAGTNPQVADTDQDGLLDGDDHEPLHAPAPFLGFEGQCGGAGGTGAFVLFVALRLRREET